MSPNFFFASNVATNNLRYLGGNQVGIGKEPGTIFGIRSPNPRLDVDGAINFTDALYLSGTKIVPSIDSIGDVYISHNPQNFFIGADSATEVFDSDYVFESDYKLRTLEEVELHKERSHSDQTLLQVFVTG